MRKNPTPTTTRRRTATLAAIGLLAVVGLGACGSDSDSSSDTTVAPETPATEASATETSAAASEAAVAMSADCALDKLKLVEAGKLTIGTDKPAYSPWFSDDDPTNGKGFESATAWAVAETLGFTKEQVVWTVVPFSNSYAPGTKNFDFDINQISITDERKAAVDFSDGYYQVNQAVVALTGSKIANATTIAELKDAKLGAQVGTTSLAFIKEVVAPTAEPLVYDDNNGAKAALAANQIDGIVLDLPTAFFVSAVEIEGSKVVGQFAARDGGEEFGMLFEKGNPLVGCVNEALAVLRSSGKLAAIQQAELSDATSAPVFQ
jgi:polar amino acid transport system substrate-binding protein